MSSLCTKKQKQFSLTISPLYFTQRMVLKNTNQRFNNMLYTLIHPFIRVIMSRAQIVYTTIVQT